MIIRRIGMLLERLSVSGRGSKRALGIFSGGGRKARAAERAAKLEANTQLFNFGKRVQQETKAMRLALPEPSAEAVAASKPRINVAKATGMNLEEFNMSQVIKKDGTHVRFYRKPGENKITFVTEDLGSFHKETIYGYKGEGNVTTVTMIGNNKPKLKITHKTPQGQFRIYEEGMEYADGINQKVSTNTFIGKGDYLCPTNIPDNMRYKVVEKFGVNDKHDFNMSMVIDEYSRQYNQYTSFMLKNAKIDVSKVKNNNVDSKLTKLAGFESKVNGDMTSYREEPMRAFFHATYDSHLGNYCYRTVENRYRELDLTDLLKPFEN